MDQESPEKGEMSFLQHLEELRWHLVRAAIAIVTGMTLAFANKTLLFDVIILGVKQPGFFTYRLLCRFSAKLAAWFPDFFTADIICIGQNLPPLQNLTMAGQFTAHIMAALIGGTVLAFPYVLWEIWRFIKPALHNNERKYSTGFVTATSFLFIVGILFGYFVICPLSVNFFLNYQVADEVTTNPTLGSYVSLITTAVLGCGLLFELPILIYFLTKIGLVTPKSLKKYRKHALVGCLALSAIITPPDVFSQLLVTGPLLFLYEISIMISGIVVRRKKREEMAQAS